MSVIQAVGKQRQETHESEANLDYRVRAKSDQATLKTTKNNSVTKKEATVRSSKQNLVKKVILQVNTSTLQLLGIFVTGCMAWEFMAVRGI